MPKNLLSFRLYAEGGMFPFRIILPVYYFILV